jgi:hypothetical protein
MAVHVAEAADVHQNIESQRSPGVECAQSLIMSAAMTEA